MIKSKLIKHKENTTIKELKHILDKFGAYITILPNEKGLEVTIADRTMDTSPTKCELQINESFENRFKELIKDFEG